MKKGALMNILKQLQWVAAHLSWLTMVFSPVALGAEAEKLSKQQLAQMIQEFGLNKKSTVGEFWQKSKAYYPPHIYQELEQFVKLNPNLEMPAFEVSSAKATDNSEIPVLQSTQNGKTNRIQFFGKKDNWAKFNNQVLSEADLERPDDIFKRLMANDIKVKKEYDALAKKAQGPIAKKTMSKESMQQMRDFSRFKGFPTITPMMWSSMTLEQRAGHIVKMRMMHMTAQKVLATSSGKPTSKNFMELIFGNDAYAQAPAPTPVVAVKTADAPKDNRKNRVSKTSGGKRINIPDSAKTCIVAGYVGAEGIGDNSNGKNRRLCSLDIALGMYDAVGAPSYVREANNDCTNTNGKSSRACNPMQYSFPEGKPICVDQNDAELQTATHREGKCDKASPLSSSALAMEFNGKDYSNVQPATVRQKMIEEDQRKTDFAMTKDFIAGILKHGDKNRNSKLLAMFQDGKWDAELDREMVSMQQVYEDEVNRAIKSCHENVALMQADSQQKGACDQLHRRWLFTEKFVAEFRSKACPDGSAYIGAYAKDEQMTGSTVVVAKNSLGDDVTKTALNKRQLEDSVGTGLCKCTTDGKSTSFKGKCEVPAVIVPPLLPLDPKEANGQKVTSREACPGGTLLIDSDESNQCRCDGKDGNIVPTGTPQEDVERLCKKSDLWKWILGGLGIAALLAVFFKKKKKDSPEVPITKPEEPVTPPVTPPGVPPVKPPPNFPPPQSCPAPKIGTFPTCGCPASEKCTPPQRIYTETCQCTDIPTCSDGSLDLSNCPKPPPPPPGIPSEGGAGNNCPNGNCNGGAPTQKNKK